MAILNQRFRSLYTLLLVALLLISGCAPRVGAGSSSADSNSVVLDIPAILITYDESGEASLFNRPVAELSELLGADLSSFSLEADTIKDMQDGNIQHIQINNQPNGLRFYINNNPLPGMIFDEDSLAALVETLAAMGNEVGPLDKLAWVLPNMGMGLALQMPVASGNRAVPMQVPNVRVLSTQEALNLFDRARNAPITSQITLDYNADGTFELQGNNPMLMFGLQAASGALQLPADTIGSMMDRGIESFGLTIVDGGLLIALNGNTLPFIQYNNDQELANLLAVAGTFAGPEVAGILPLVQQFLLPLKGLNLAVSFPPAPDGE